MILGFGILMYCRFTWQFMKSFLDSISYRGGGLFGVRTRFSILYCHLVKGVGYIYDWDTGSFTLI